MQILQDAGLNFCQIPAASVQGYGRDRLLDEQVCLSTTARNFKGRMGAFTWQVYLASPYTVAASAIAGSMVDPREVTDVVDGTALAV